MNITTPTFRVLAVAAGAAALLLTVYVSNAYWLAIGVGVAFGVIGLLIDYSADDRFGRGQVSAWMLIAGGAALIFINAKRPFLLSDGHGGWIVVSQYLASIVLIWGVLLFVLPHKSRT